MPTAPTIDTAFKPYVTVQQRTTNEYVSHRLTVNVQADAAFLIVNTGDARGHYVRVTLTHDDLLQALAAMHAAKDD